MTISNARFYRVIPQNDFASKLANEVKLSWKNAPPYEVVWWFFATCIVLGNIRMFAGDLAGPIDYMTAYGGAAGCAWAWLFTRALFRPNDQASRWPVALLLTTVLFEGSWEISNGLAATGIAGESQRLIANASSFLCVSLLALVFVEALNGFNQQESKKEQRFRKIYIAFFGTALAVTMLWALGAPEGSLAAQSQLPAQLAFGFLAIFGGRFAIAFRKKHLLADKPVGEKQRPKVRSSHDKGDIALANQIRNVLENDKLFTTPKLRVSDLSTALGEPEYKVTQCITSVMGYQNFNRLVNEYRIANAKTKLEDHDQNERQILAIALESGFNSIGPFNRAFKKAVGVTPRQFRSGQASP